MNFIELLIIAQIGRFDSLTIKGMVARFCRKFIVLLIEHTWIFKNFLQERAIKYWMAQQEGRSLQKSIYGNTDGLEKFLTSLPINDLLHRERVFIKLVELQKERMRESIDPNKKTVAICFPTAGFRGHIGNIADKLKSKGYNVFTLPGEAGKDDNEKQQNIFYIPGNLLSNVDFVDIFISPQIGPFNYLTVKGKVVHFFHDIHDSALPDIEAHYKIMLGVDYFFVSSHFLAKRLKHLISLGKQRYLADTATEKEICLIPGGYPMLDGNLEYFKKHQQKANALVYAPTIPPEKKIKEMESLVATPQHSDQIIEAILDNFTEYDLIFRPHPHSIHYTDIQNIAEKYGNNARFTFDDNADFYMGGFSRSALMITDMSGVAYTYAFTTLRPVVFFSYNEAEVMRIFGAYQYFIDRNKIGYVSQSVDDMVDKIKLLLAVKDEFSSKIKEYRDSTIYNIGTSENYFVDNIEYIIEYKRNPDWVYL